MTAPTERKTLRSAGVLSAFPVADPIVAPKIEPMVTGTATAHDIQPSRKPSTAEVQHHMNATAYE